ncbi:MAG TPA: XrtA/PEP-CTERM system TPR-repeat protein PrsT [Alphaproteobacteria bacterium]|nr:XrtA/PEP-CTERM system TPR-repeat protein PrsT [Alphaproteobacteria bacterium]
MSLQQIRRKMLASGALVALPLMLAAPALWSGYAAAAAGDPAAAKKHEQEADQLIAKDDLKSAEIELKNAVKADPDNGPLRLKLADIAIQMNDIDGAQVELKSARDHGADEAKVIPLLGRTYMVQGKFDQVLQEFPVKDNAPPAVRIATLTVRAEAQMQLKKVEDARSSLMAAEQIDPKAPMPKLGLARIAFTLGQYDDAMTKADELLAIAPTADVHMLKGEILERKGDNNGAMGEFDQAIKADPNNLGGYIERAQLLISQNQDAKAQADIKAAQTIAPRSVPAQYLQALVLAKAKDFAGADNLLTKYAAAFPAFPRGYYLQAIVKSELRQYEQAESAIGAYLGAVPGDLGGQRVKADILLRKGDAIGAADVLEKITADAPDDAQSLGMLGQAYMQLRKPQQAIDAFERANKLAPDNASILRGLGLNHISQGQTDKGIAELEKAYSLAPDDQQTSQALVLVYTRQRQFDKANKLADDMRKRAPNDAAVAGLTGMIALASQNVAGAEAAYGAAIKQFPDYLPTKLQLAYIYALQGAQDKAVATYQEVLAKDPANVAALQNLSALYQGRNEIDKAIDLWVKAHKQAPDNVPITVGLVEGYIQKRDWDSGLAAVRDMQVRLPNEPRLFAMRAELELQKGAPKDAVVSLQRLAELQPQDPASRRDLAIAQEKAGDLPGAIASIGEARKLDPNNIGLAAEEVRLLGLRNPDDAIAAAQRLAQQMPDAPAAQAVEGDYLVSLKRPADSKAAYVRAFQAHPSIVLAERISASDLRDGKVAEAGKILNDWANAHPDDIPAKFAVANFALGQKDYATAKAKYEGLLTAERAADPLILNNLAVIYQKGNDPRALEYAQKAHIAAPANGAIADTLGWIMVQKGDGANGIKFLQQAHDAQPNDPDVQYHLAFAFDSMGKKPEATDLVKKALANPRDFDSKKDAQALLDKLSKG